MKCGRLMGGMRESELSTREFIPWFGLPQRRPYVHDVEALTKSIASQQSSLFRAWHRLWNIVHPMHRCLAWRCRFNRWPSYLDLVFAWSSFGAQTCTDVRASKLPTTIGCTDATCIGSSGATCFSRTRPIQRFFEFFLRVFVCMAFLLHPWDLEIFT